MFPSTRCTQSKRLASNLLKKETCAWLSFSTAKGIMGTGRRDYLFAGAGGVGRAGRAGWAGREETPVPDCQCALPRGLELESFN